MGGLISTLPSIWVGDTAKDGFAPPLDVKIEALVCSGPLSDVFQGTWCDAKVAIKTLREVEGTSGNQSKADIRRRLDREARTWIKLKHDNVLPCLGLTRIEYGNSTREAIVSPWMQNGNIPQFFEKASLHQKSLIRKLQLVTQIAKGLEYLHERDVIHGDIKANNVLVDNNGNARIADFGRSFTLTADDCSKNVLGCVAWMAPEVLQHDVATPPLGKESDVWAFGITVLEIFDGRDRLWGRRTSNAASLVTRICQGEKPQSDDYPHTNEVTGQWESLTDCFAFVPKDRQSAHQIANRLGGVLDALDGAVVR